MAKYPPKKPDCLNCFYEGYWPWYKNGRTDPPVYEVIADGKIMDGRFCEKQEKRPPVIDGGRKCDAWEPLNEI